MGDLDQIVLDRRPDGVGLEAFDWAGMQLSRIWARPLVELDGRSGRYRMLGAQSVEREDDHTWIVLLAADLRPASAALGSLRRTVRARGPAAFFFIAGIAALDEARLRITTRQAYGDIVPFLDSFDFWLGLDVASAAGRARQRTRDADHYRRADGSSVRVVTDRTAGREPLRGRSIAAGLPMDSTLSLTATETSLTFVCLPLHHLSSPTPVSSAGLAASLEDARLDAAGFVAHERPSMWIDDDRRRFSIEYADFPPNGVVAGALARAARCEFPSVGVATRRRPFSERPEVMFRGDMALPIVVPLNSSSTGLVRALVSSSWASPASEERAVDLTSGLVDVERGAAPARALQDRFSDESFTGFIGRYVAGSSNDFGWDPPVSSLGFLPLEEMETS